LKNEIFEACLKEYEKSDGHTSFWPSLFETFKQEGFKSSEDLRDKFKRERKKRRIPARGGDPAADTMRMTAAKPRVGVLDIETLPLIAYAWALWDQNIGIEQIIADSCMLSWAGKYLNEAELHSDILTSKEEIARDTRRNTESCWRFLSECDVVIGHNFASFDMKHINNEFMKHGLPPLKFIIVDTLLVARQHFSFTSNKMKFINAQLKIKEKIDNSGFVLWKKCSEGDKVSLDEMLEYNRGDIFATEELFYRIRPYVHNFNIALYNEINTMICPVCGSEELDSIGYYYTSAGKWESVRCKRCGCVSRKKENLLSREKRRSLLVNS